MNVLELEDVSITYQNTKRSSEAMSSFAVPEGRIVAIVGESGSGKVKRSSARHRLAAGRRCDIIGPDSVW